MPPRPRPVMRVVPLEMNVESEVPLEYSTYRGDRFRHRSRTFVTMKFCVDDADGMAVLRDVFNAGRGHALMVAREEDFLEMVRDRDGAITTRDGQEVQLTPGLPASTAADPPPITSRRLNFKRPLDS